MYLHDYYNRLWYEIKRDLTNFSVKISQWLKRPQQKFIHQMIYGILDKGFDANDYYRFFYCMNFKDKKYLKIWENMI